MDADLTSYEWLLLDAEIELMHRQWRIDRMRRTLRGIPEFDPFDDVRSAPESTDE